LKNIAIHETNQSWNEKISVEDLNHLNFALDSCGEFHSCYVSFKQAGQISDDNYWQLDKLHTLKVHTFIDRLIRHIPDKHFPMIRYAGLFSNRF
jgi:hypothetical protein